MNTEGLLSAAAVLLRGLGQIMLQRSALTGLFFLAGITFGSCTMGAAALLGVACGTLTAKWLGFDPAAVRSGLYGFSAALVGVALVLFVPPEPVVWAAVVVGSAAASVLQHFFLTRKWPLFTLPFVLVTWSLLLVFRHVWPIGPSDIAAAAQPLPLDLLYPLRGYGQVIFQGSVVSGSLFLAGVLASSVHAALFALLAAVLAGCVAWAAAPFLVAIATAPAGPVGPNGVIVGDIAMGLYSFNAVLCGIAMAGPRASDVLWAMGTVLLSLLVTALFMAYGWPQLTFPFVAATALGVVLRHRFALRHAAGHE